MASKRKKSLVFIKTIYLDPEVGLVFVGRNNKKYALNYGQDASGAISQITMRLCLLYRELK